MAEGTKEILAEITDDEAFIWCLLYQVQAAYRGGNITKTTQHVVAFLALMDEMGKEARQEMNDRIKALAITLDYPNRARDLIERRTKEMAEMEKEKDESHLPEMTGVVN